MSIITNWPKNAVYPDKYKINVAALGKPLKVSSAVDIVSELDSLFDIRQIANCFEVFLYTGGTCNPYILRQRLPCDNGSYEHNLFALDSSEYIHRIEISRKVSWADYSTVAVFDRIPEFDNTFAITNSLIELAPSELDCFNKISALIAELPGRVFNVEIPELPLIALINEMNGKV